LAGGVAGFSLFRGAQWARRFVGLIAVLIVIVTIVQFVAYRSPPWACDVASVLALVSVVLLLLERIAKELERKHTDAA
jgi:flagellar biogenesis protein FliO